MIGGLSLLAGIEAGLGSFLPAIDPFNGRIKVNPLPPGLRWLIAGVDPPGQLLSRPPQLNRLLVARLFEPVGQRVLVNRPVQA